MNLAVGGTWLLCSSISRAHRQHVMWTSSLALPPWLSHSQPERCLPPVPWGFQKKKHWRSAWGSVSCQGRSGSRGGCSQPAHQPRGVGGCHWGASGNPPGTCSCREAGPGGPRLTFLGWQEVLAGLASRHQAKETCCVWSWALQPATSVTPGQLKKKCL